MDRDRFDALSRLLGQGINRRAALAALAALAAGGIEAAAAKQTHRKTKHKRPPHNEAKTPRAGCSKEGQPCAPTTKCCGNLSCDATTNRCVKPAPPGQCGANEAKCNGTCVDITTTNNCGGCGVQCPMASCSGAVCTNGVCGLTPIPGCCTTNAECDDHNACTIDACGTDHTCSHNPEPSTTTCGAGGNGICCGGHCCEAGANAHPTCSGSTCGFTCNTGFHACGGTCVSNDDVAHCGTSCNPCSAPASATATCANGQCGFACNTGFHACGNACFADDDVQHCGTTCASCGTDEACIGGTCTSTCRQPIPNDPDGTEGLQTAINNAAAGETIHLCAGTWHLTSPVTIDKALTLISVQGNAVLLAVGTHRVLTVSASANTPVRLDGLGITGGIANATDDNYRGGGIYNTATLTLANSSVDGNRAAHDGGGIYNFLGALTLDNSHVTNNAASVAAFGGGIVNTGGTLRLENGSTVQSNDAAAEGGGIFNDGTTTLNAGCQVTGNSVGAYSGGGGIYDAGGTVDLADTTIVTNNVDYGFGRDNCRPAGAVPNCIG